MDRRFDSLATRGRSLWLVMGLGSWILLSAIVASQNFVEHLLAGSHVSFPLQFVWMLVVLGYWVVAAPVILWLGKRFPIERHRPAMRTVLHMGLAAAITLFHAPLVVVVTALLKPFPLPPGVGFWRALGFTVTYTFHTGFLLYWIVLGSGLAYASYRRARQRELHAAQLEVELSRARLHALKAQIHPHFLFNALNTVAMMVRNQNNDEAVEMIAQLGELFRESLRSAPQHEVPLSQEVELANRYLHVERCRFADRLQVQTEVPAELENAMVPHLVLQPLVENAVRHGISRSTGRGLVRITAEKVGEQLTIAVHDNGPGEDLPREVSSDDGNGVGLENVRARLEQLYGSAGKVCLDRRVGEGTVARIAIPYHLQEQLAPMQP
ncbi:MAG: hypothetical protein GY906_01715 [bacterium]|nr:hypothetical protein [bacterium]